MNNTSMNIEQGPNTENILTAQQRVFEDEIKEEHIENVFAFIVNNAPLFRYFAEHLPKNLYKVWDAASGELADEAAIKELEDHYEIFRNEIMSALESLDQDAVTALNEYAEKGDVDGASKILETYFSLRDNAKAKSQYGEAA